MNSLMKLLQEKYYGKLIKRLSEIPFNTLFARSVLETVATGKVWVDNIHEPKTVFIAHEYGMSLLFGDTENQEFNAGLADYMLNIYGDRVKHEWLQVYPEKWNTKLHEILNDKILNYAKLDEEHSQQELAHLIEKYKKNHIIQWTRLNLIYKGNHNPLNIAPNCTIRRIDSDIYKRLAGSVIPKYFWQTPEIFLSNGIGYVLMKDNSIVSVAFSAFKFEDVLEIGIETMANFRGMGFAKQVCQKLLDFCKENNYLPIWACRKENIGSLKLAKDLGFEESLATPYYELVSNLN